jgi:hypothetical protein
MTTRYRNANHARVNKFKRLNIIKTVRSLRSAEKALLSSVRAGEEEPARVHDLDWAQSPSDAQLALYRLQNIRATIGQLKAELAVARRAARIAQISKGRELDTFAASKN